ncbi:FAD-dependent oxidoreductase [Breznakiella homolactica]|uniref:FAD-dependent oxidoreductase n=1 Tax=Breznakiella homolactica TaxID=2798577 RepID=A0A7T7XLS2_9SPIR|nr:FAD-dependent oxidoreductase [Breznakiella homolactica]QQO08701.1 FAD-dependent oxidoreductase [Breznakiella homolactica]
MHKHAEFECDVAVIGAGPGGLTAAIAAAREGMQVILVERTAVLGGCASSGLGILGYLDAKGRKTLGGISWEYLEKLKEIEGTMMPSPCPVHNSITPISSEAFKCLAVRMCKEAGVKVLFNCDLTGVQVENGTVKAVRVYGKCTDIDIKAKVFVDGTGDGDLAYMAGAEYVRGQDGTALMQPSTMMFSVTGHDLEKFYAFLEKNPSELGIKEKYAEGYDLNFFRTVPGHCLIGLTEMIKKAQAAGDMDVPRNQFIYIKTASEKILAINTSRIINIDASDPFELSAGIEEGYRQVEVLMAFMRKYIPGFEHVALANISSTLGIRETRHFIGKKRLTREMLPQYISGAPDDTVALCSYNIDIHSGDGDYIDLYRVEEPFGIPYGCLVPETVKGLFLAGRTLSVDGYVFAAARVMGPLIACAEAIGVAASMAVKENLDPAEIDVAALRKTLLKNGAILTV